MKTLIEQIETYVPVGLGIRDEFCKKLEDLGIDLEKNHAEKPSGMHALTLLVPEKKIVIKFFHQEAEEGTPTLPNSSRHILQPFCHCKILGNLLAIFPMLEREGVGAKHVETLRIGLEKEGYFFWDDKLENIGLVGDVPYLIDADAIKIDREKSQTRDGSRVSQWDLIHPRFPIDGPIKNSGEWSFAIPATATVATTTTSTLLHHERSSL